MDEPERIKLDDLQNIITSMLGSKLQSVNNG